MRAVIRQEGEGERLWFAGGGIFTVKAAAEDTGGALFVFEDHVVKGKTTPLHTHPDMDEAIYVLDGEILVHADGEQQAVGTGGLVVAPRGLPHAFLVTSDTAHLLCWLTPATGEGFYRAASEPVRSDADETRGPDIERLRAAAERSESIEILGPPPFEQVAAVR